MSTIATQRPNSAALVTSLRNLRQRMRDAESTRSAAISATHESQQASARNLVHYLGARQYDLRDVQRSLSILGLSSLGRFESATLDTVNAVVNGVLAIAGSDTGEPAPRAPISIARAPDLLERRTNELLGNAQAGASGRIMVTMPTEAASSPELIRELLESGMSVMRINSAHDGPDEWKAMIDHLRRAEREMARPCKVYFDLAGPKLRTGALEPGPEVVAWYPKKDARGRMLSPVRLWLHPDGKDTLPERSPDARIPLPEEFLFSLRDDDLLSFTDSRGKHRQIRITKVTDNGRWAKSVDGTFITSGTTMTLNHPDGRVAQADVGRLPPIESPLLLRPNDTLILERDPAPGHPARYDEQGHPVTPATISCTLPQVFQDVRPGHKIWFDDGKIGGVVREVTADQMRIEITQARPKGRRLRSDKGINLPDTELDLPALTEHDLENLAFAVKHCDIVGLSFVRHADDVDYLGRHMADLGAEHLGIVLKIETRQGFERLPSILLSAMKHPHVGVMIARGDLAVECGFERLAEVQEEILWLCEAAHVPVIWATQVLESLAKKGLPTRAEITDAAMSVRAECVMLNKGPYITKAVRTLDNVLRRMFDHQTKKRAMLRPLRVAQGFE